MFYFTVGPLYQKIVTFTRMRWRRERLDKNQMFLGLVRVEEGDFCALQTLELLVIFFRGPLRNESLLRPVPMPYLLCRVQGSYPDGQISPKLYR